ncbi:MAG: hypothetical protein ACJAYI_001193, partial [Myxococcota bacterium]
SRLGEVGALLPYVPRRSARSVSIEIMITLRAGAGFALSAQPLKLDNSMAIKISAR